MRVRFPDRPDGLAAVVGNVSPVTDPATNLVRVRCPFVSGVTVGVPHPPESYVKAEIITKESEALVRPDEGFDRDRER